jgi:hypothetical protein
METSACGFTDENQKKIKVILEKHNLLSPEQRASMLYALSEIAESMEKISLQMIPRLASMEAESDVSAVKDALWDIREEFRHVQYHIDDGQLKDL